MADITRFTRRLVIRGGKGSGHRGHKGIPGQRGGSLPTYPEGMAPSDQPAPTTQKWRTLTDEELKGPRPVPPEYMQDAESERIIQVAYNGRMSDRGRRMGADLMGGRLPDATMRALHEFYLDVLVAKDIDAFWFGRAWAKGLEDAANSLGYGALDDIERGLMRETATYITNLVDPASWENFEDIGTGDEEVQLYILQEIANTMKPFSDSIFLDDGTRNKSKLDRFLAQSIGENYEQMADRLSEKMSAYHDLTHQQTADPIEGQVERQLIDRAEVIDRAFAYAETQGEKVRQGLVAAVSDEAFNIPDLTANVAEMQAKNDAAREAYLKKQVALQAENEASAEYKAAREALNRDYDIGSMTRAEVDAAQDSRRDAYLVISKLDNQVDDALHKSDEWFAMAATTDYMTEAEHDLDSAKKARNEAARRFIEEQGFGSASTKIEGNVVSTGRRGMSKADVAFAAERNKETREWLAKMVAPDVFKAGVPLNYRNQSVRRGSQWADGYTMYSGAGVEDHLHESGHWLEEHNPDTAIQAVAFLRYRNKGEEYIRMSAARKRTQKKRAAAGLSTNHLYSRWFKASEIAAVNGWRDPYAGKKYGNNYYATEVLSMGLQWLYEDPVAFAVEDPEHFNYTLAMIAGAK